MFYFNKNGNIYCCSHTVTGSCVCYGVCGSGEGVREGCATCFTGAVPRKQGEEAVLRPLHLSLSITAPFLYLLSPPTHSPIHFLPLFHVLLTSQPQPVIPVGRYRTCGAWAADGAGGWRCTATMCVCVCVLCMAHGPAKLRRLLQKLVEGAT